MRDLRVDEKDQMRANEREIVGEVELKSIDERGRLKVG